MKMDAVTCQLAVQMFNPQVTIHAFSPKIKTLMLANPNGKRMLAEPALWATNSRAMRKQTVIISVRIRGHYLTTERRRFALVLDP